MAHFNNNNANFYSSPFASEELYANPFPDQMRATEEADSQTHPAFTDLWTMGELPGPSDPSLADLCAAANHQSLAPQNLHATQIDSYGQSPYPDHQRSAVDQQARPYCPSETPADAENNQTNTEESEVPTTEKTLRQYRIQMQKDAGDLCKWAQQGMGLPDAPSLNRILAIATKIIPTIRPSVHRNPRLLTGQIRKRTAVGSRNADGEFKRRNVERELLRELSRYYPLGKGQNAWTRLSLLQCVLRDLEDLPDPQGHLAGHISELRRYQRRP